MTMGPEPIRRIFLRSVRFGMGRWSVLLCPRSAMAGRSVSLATSYSPPMILQEGRRRGRPSRATAGGRHDAAGPADTTRRIAMLRSLGWVAAFALLTASAGAQDDKAYSIKFRKPADGETSLVQKSEKGDEDLKIADNNGNPLKDEAKKTEKTFVYRETVLARKGTARPTRLKRAYQKAELTANGETKALPYQGKTLLIEKKDGKYAFHIEGGDELTGDDAKHLDEEFNKKKLDDS